MDKGVFQWKKLMTFWAVVLIMGLTTGGCGQSTAEISARVEVRRDGQMHQLYRDGKPFFVRGAAGHEHMAQLRALGGNAVRTWSTDNAQAVLDSAYAHGLSVMMGLYMLRTFEGMDYADETAVRVQEDALMAQVQRYKDHPALLLWGIGNEVQLLSDDLRVWKAVQRLARRIRATDPHHPTVMPLAGFNRQQLNQIYYHCPDIDIVGFNTFGDLVNVPARMKQYYPGKPYLITEWGARGYWETPRTAWDALLEPSSTEKAAWIKQAYAATMQTDTAHCLGGFAFFWGQKQERTPTLFSLFLPEGQPTEQLDALHYLWQGSWPSQRAPRITSPLGFRHPTGDQYFLPGDTITATVQAQGHAPDVPLHYHWELVHDQEATEAVIGGGTEVPLRRVAHWQTEEGTLRFAVPRADGPYRMLLYVTDPQQKACTDSAPLYVLP